MGRSVVLLFAVLAQVLWRTDAHAQVDADFLREHSETIRAGDAALILEKAGPTTHVEAAIVVAADPISIWEILVACEIAPEYVPNVVSCQSVEVLDDGAAELFIQTVKPAFFIPAFEHVFRMEYAPYERIAISRVSGPIRQLNSSWHLQSRDDGTVLLSYSLDVDPGIPIPRFFVRQTLRRDLPRVLKAVQARAEVAAAPVTQ